MVVFPLGPYAPVAPIARVARVSRRDAKSVKNSASAGDFTSLEARSATAMASHATRTALDDIKLGG
jgi:hypothetical protein